MAHKKGVGSTDNGRDSISKRLGVKLYGGQAAKAGNIIVRQRGTKFHAGNNVYMSKDFSLHAAIDGQVVYRKQKKNRTYVSILPFEGQETAAVVDEKVAPVSEPQTPVTEAPEAPAEEQTTPEAETEKGEPQTPVTEAPEAPAEEQPQETTPEAETEKSEPQRPQSGDKIELPSGKKVKVDDLKVIEGIGPKIEGLFHDAGIKSWKDLAEADMEKLKEVLAEAGSRYRMHDPTTWSKQAQLASEGKWEELEQYQDELKGGRAEEEDAE